MNWKSLAVSVIIAVMTWIIAKSIWHYFNLEDKIKKLGDKK